MGENTGNFDLSSASVLYKFTRAYYGLLIFQIKGLGTALKILFSKPSQLKEVADYVTRNEVVALLNAFGR